MSIADLRREYTRASLNRNDLEADPLVQFHKWFDQALKSQLPEPNAMTLATADKAGRPSARIVLLKGADQRGFVFVTNHDSQKGLNLAENPHAALVFYWAELERQVRVEGGAVKVPREESEAYFKSRPKASCLAALASNQSSIIPSRQVLEQRFEDIQVRYQDAEVPLPENWGGYVIAPHRYEFWQGRPSRLHDRFCYTRTQDNSWQIDRLSP